MDTSMIEATQALEYDDDYNEENDEDQDGNRTVGYLNVPCQKGFPGKQYPITEGDNVIGRGDHCNIYIPLKGLSREHACIEIKGENHFIYDKGSRNKTKRNNFFLSTLVRYELKDGDKLLFGDVNCTYKIGTETEDGDDTGSETGSESMFETAPSFSANGLTVLETPAPPRAGKGFTGNLIIPESDSEPEDDLTKTVTTLEADTQDTSAENLMGAPTQAFVSESDVTTDDDFSPKKKSILTAATQAYDMDTASDDDSPSKRNLLMAATQAFVADSDESPSPKKSKKNISPLEPTLKYDMPEVIEATQGYDMDGDSEGENEEDDDEKERRKQLLCQATQAVKGAEDSDVETDNEKEEEESRKLLLGQATQAFKGTDQSDDETDNEKEEESRKQLLCQATQAFKGAEGSDDETDNEKDNTTDMSKLLAQPTQAFFADKQEDKEKADDVDSESSEEFVLEGDTDNEDDDDNEAARNMFAAPTLACDADNMENTNESEVPDDQTVQVEDKTLAVCDEATQAVTDKTCNIDATVTVGEDKTQLVVDKTDDTLAVEDTTQAITDMETQAVTDASPTKNPYTDDTQVLSGNSPNKKSAINQEDAGTQLIDNDATQVLPGTSNVDDSPVKKGVTSASGLKNKPHDITEMETQAVEDAATMAIQDDNTKPAADRQDSGSFDITAVSTLAPSDSVEYSLDDKPKNNDKGNITEQETQVIDNATVKVDEDETMAVSDDTVPPPISGMVDKGDQIDQTVPVIEDVKQTIPISDTVPVPAAETVAMETVPVTDDVKETLPVSETVPVSDITAAETVAIETVLVSDTVPVADPEVMETVPVANEIDTDKVSETFSVQEEEVKSANKNVAKAEKEDQSDKPKGKGKASVNVTNELDKPTKTSNRRGRGKKNNAESDETVNQDQTETESKETVEVEQADTSTTRRGRRGKSTVNSNETSESKKPYQTKSGRTVKRKTLLDEEDSETPIVKDSADKTSVKDDRKSDVGEKSNGRTSRSRIKKKINEATEDNQDKTSVESAVDESGDKNQSKTGRGRRSKKPAEPVNNTEQEPETQIYGASPRKGQAGTTSGGVPGSSAGVDEADTQMYGASPVKGKVCVEEAATQMYGLSPKKGSSSEEPTQTFGDEDATPSLSLPDDDEGLVIPKPALVPLPSRSPYKSAMASPEKKESSSPKRPEEDDGLIIPKPALVPLLSRSPYKSAMVSPEKKKSPSPKRSDDDEGLIIPKPALVPLPSRSPYKSAMVSPEKKKSPSPKRVQFTSQSNDTSTSTDTEQVQDSGAENSGNRPRRGKAKEGKDDKKAVEKPGRKRKSVAKGDSKVDNESSTSEIQTKTATGEDDIVQSDADKQDMDITEVANKRPTRGKVKQKVEEKTQGGSETTDSKPGRKTRSEPVETKNDASEKKQTSRGRRSTQTVSSNADEKLNVKDSTKKGDKNQSDIVDENDETSSEISEVSEIGTENVSGTRSKRLRTNEKVNEKPQRKRKSIAEEISNTEDVSDVDSQTSQTQSKSRRQTQNVALEAIPERTDKTRTSRSRRTTQPVVEENGTKSDKQKNTGVSKGRQTETVVDNPGDKKDQNSRKSRRTKSGVSKDMETESTHDHQENEPANGNSEENEVKNDNKRKSRRTGAETIDKVDGQQSEKIDVIKGKRKTIAETSVASKEVKEEKDVKQNTRTSRRTTGTVSKDAESEKNDASVDSKTADKSKDGKQTTRTSRRTTDTVSKDAESETSESVDTQEADNETVKGKRITRTKIETEPSVTSESKTNKTGGKSSTSDNTDDTKGKAAATKPVAGRRVGKRKGTDESSSDSTDLSQNDEGTPAKKQKIADVSTKIVMSTPKNTSKQPTNTETPKNKPVESNVTDSPTLRKTTVSGQKPKIMFTGVTDEQGEKVVKELGGELVSSVTECTHLVTDQIRRTVKFLCCLSRGVPIVSPQWLTSSKKCGFFSDTAPHLIRDDASEKKFKCSLQRSLSKAGEGPLLEGYKIHVTKSVKPPPEHMKDILKCAGAQYLTTMPKSSSPTTVIISCDEDRSVCDAAIKNDITVVNAEFILTGILRQEVDLNSYKLFADTAQEPQSKKRKR